MLRDQTGQQRSADVVGGAVRVTKIATGEIKDEIRPVDANKRKGNLRRAAKLSPERRMEIAKTASAARWGLTETAEPERGHAL